MWSCCASKEIQPIFLGSWDHQYKHGLQVRNRKEVVEPVLNLFGLGNSKPTADPGRRSALMELATAIHLDGHDHSNNSRTADGKTHLHGTMETIHAIHHSTTIHTTPLYPTTESKANDTLEPHNSVQTGMVESVRLSDPVRAGDSAANQCVQAIIVMSKE